ncbi:tetratricopeptide repeat protein [Primorskyibacter sp. S187A]|uniref:tetratricopeptide repeat protein n=1 Tax=Primorskyibacter sp. S187A TaxID=3415130 RepID=UPI003C79ACD4
MYKPIGLVCLTLTFLAACDTGSLSTTQRGPFAPEVDRRGEQVDQLLVGHRLLASGEAELALGAFNRAAAQRGLDDAEVLSSLGSANLALGRLNQSEQLLRRAVKAEDAWPEVWNNLGVVLMERGKNAEAEQILRRAFALSNGENDSIRDNLRLALAKMEKIEYGDEQEQEFKLVRRGTSDYLIRRAN